VRRFYLMQALQARETARAEVPKVPRAIGASNYWVPAPAWSMKVAWSLFIFFKLSIGK
jgi:hypothetical protein